MQVQERPPRWREAVRRRTVSTGRSAGPQLGSPAALLAVVVLLGVAVRLPGLAADLPYLYTADEPTNLAVVDRMVDSGEANPRFFNYPSLFLYLQALVHLDGPLLSWLPGDLEVAPTSMAMGSSFSPTPVAVLVHRGLSVALGALVVVLVWVTARRLTRGLLPAVVAALLVALSPTLIVHSRYVTPDIAAAAMVMVSCLLAVRLLARGTLSAHALAGLGVGLAASAKYNAVLVAVSVVAASLLCARPGGVRRALVGLPVAGLAAVASFVLTTPYAVLDRAAFGAALAFERAHYATGHAGMEGGTPAFYAKLLLRYEAALVGLAALAVVLLVRQGRLRAGEDPDHRTIGWRAVVVLAAFPSVYGAVIATLPVRNDRTVMLVLPPLAVLAALAVEPLRRALARSSRAAVVAVVGPALLVLGYGAWTALPSPGRSTHEAAQDWLAERAEPGATVLIESYGPYLDPADYAIVTRTRLIDGPLPAPGEYDYLIASQGMYGRFLDDPTRYPQEAAAYRALLGSAAPLAVLTGDGPTLQILRGP